MPTEGERDTTDADRQSDGDGWTDGGRETTGAAVDPAVGVNDSETDTTAADPGDAATDASGLLAGSTRAEDAAVDERTDANVFAGAGPSREGVGVATLFEVLGNERRRHVIRELRDREDPVTLSDLAAAVAAREHEVPVADLTTRQRKSTYTALQQTHLPKMDDVGVLTFDKAAGRVAPRQAITEYTLYLDVVPTVGVRRSEVYLVLAGLSAVVTAGVLSGVGPFEVLSPLAWATLVVVTFALGAAVQLFYHPLFPERFHDR